MLQFRASVVLKELIQTSPKRSLSDILRLKKTLASAYRLSAAYSDGKTPKLNIVRNGRRYLPFIQPLSSRRFLCTKTEGAIEPETAKTESVQETTADKYEINS